MERFRKVYSLLLPEQMKIKKMLEKTRSNEMLMEHNYIQVKY